MTNAIKKIIESIGLMICPSCDGEGEVGYFCGHESIRGCRMCASKGVIKSTKKQKHSKKCDLCDGRKGGCGYCDDHPDGLIEWETYELIENHQNY